MATSRSAIEFLEVPITPDGQVQLRTGPRLIDDLDEIAAFMTERGIMPMSFFATSNVNLSWLFQGDDGLPRIICLGPKLVGEARLEPDLARDTGFLNPEKFIAARLLGFDAAHAFVPAPLIRSADFDGELKRAWCIQEFAHGKCAAELSDPKERLQMFKCVGALMVRIHQIKVASENQEKSPRWYEHRFLRATTWLKKQGLISAPDEQQMIDALHRLLDKITPAPLTPIHGDLIDHNVFIGRRGDDIIITGIIDWETCQWQADPRYEVLLTAWWASGEHEGDGQIFRAVINTYNRTVPVARVDEHELDALLTLADLTWYVCVLPFTYLREHHRFEPRLTSIKRILKCLASNESYLPKGW